MQLPSKLIDDAVKEFSRLPGIGKKTALRLVLHLLKEPEDKVNRFGEAVTRMRREIQYCDECHNLSDGPVCGICADRARDRSVVCVVESIRDVIAIENTNHFRGTYHVLGGVISPMDGIGPDDIQINSLIERIGKGEIKELVMALNPTIEGDTTLYYISKQLQGQDVKITTIARGVAFGGELEYVDEMTLSRSIANRLPFENYIVNR